MASSYAKQADDMASKQESVHQQESAASAYEDSVPVSSTALDRRSMIEKALPAELALMVTDYLTINDMYAIARNNGHIGDLMGLKIKKYVDCIHDPSFSITQFKADLKRLGIDTEDKDLLLHYIGAVYFLNHDASASTEGVTVKMKEYRMSSGVSVTTTLRKDNRSVDAVSGNDFSSFRFKENEVYHTDNDSPATSQYRNGVPLSFEWYRNGVSHRDGDKPSAIFFRDGNIFNIVYKKNGEYFRSGEKPISIEYDNHSGVVKEHFKHQDKDGKFIAGALARKDYYRDRVVTHVHLGNNLYAYKTEYFPIA